MSVPPIKVTVTEIVDYPPLIKAFRLRSADGSGLPGFEAGAHLRVAVTAAGDVGAPGHFRHYSLVWLDPAHDPAGGVDDYLIAVRREDAGRGGSRFLHETVRVGSELDVGAPANTFALRAGDDDVLLIAGGIGITPISSMACALAASGRRFALHYSVRAAGHWAFSEALQVLAGGALHLYADDDPARAFDVDRLLSAGRPGQPVYVCGPKGMTDAVIATALARGWPREAVHSELFVEAAPGAGDQACEVECRASGRVLRVPADQSILDALIAAGLDPLFDCRRGECGVCTVAVIEGEVDHRDYCLSAPERAANRQIQVCVSRARGGRLVLDI